MAQRQRKNIHIYKGNDRNYKFTLTLTSGTAYDLSGATSVTLTVKDSLEDASAIFSETATDSTNGNDWTNGIVVIKITDTNSALMSSDGVYDLEIVLSSGDIVTPCYGTAFLQKNVG